MKIWNSKSRRLFIFLYDIVACSSAWLISFSLRHNFEIIPIEESRAAYAFLPLLIVVQTYCFYRLKTYRVLWRFISIHDFYHLLKASFFTTIIMMVAIYNVNHFMNVPRSVIPLYLVNSLALLCLPRFINRIYRERSKKSENSVNALIVGAGYAGERLLRDFLSRNEKQFEIIGFVDDEVYKKGQKIHNISVLGPCSKIPRLVEKHNIKQIFIAIPSATSKQMRRIVAYCDTADVAINTLPSLRDIVSGRVTIDSLKGISIEDLLGRAENQLEQSAVKTSIMGKTILITGAGGSIGSELTRQLTKFEPELLILVDHSEFNLYSISQELEARQVKNVRYLLGSICDPVFIRNIIESHHIDIIYHAAAYKHVPLLENQIRAAIHNNIIGTLNLVKHAAEYQLEKFVLISTDKAVNPCNLMGATKRVAEMICQHYEKHSHTNFSVVRFGNVLGSQGSVLPLFNKQLTEGGPLTVTHPDITRYFMSIPEAASLILQSTTLKSEGQVFVLDMGEPIKILYLAEQLIRLSGKVPYRDIEIEFTGLRPGEKLFEELFYNHEDMTLTQVKKIFMSQVQDPRSDIESILKQIQSACERCNSQELQLLVHQLVETYRPKIKSQIDSIDVPESEYAETA